jgi:hypothetical protein
VTGNNIHLVGFDLAIQNDSGDFRHQTVPQVARHRLHVIFVQAQFPGDLSVGQVQTHEVEAQDPDPQRLMMASQNRACQVVKPRFTVLAAVALPMALCVIMAVTNDRARRAGRATHTIGPSMLTDQLIALGVIDQSREIDQRR